MNGTQPSNTLPQRLHVAGRRQGLPRDRRQQGAPRRRHLRHHEPARAEAGRRVRPGGGLPADPATAQSRGNEVFHHDMVVKKIDGRQMMLDSYWDAGYVQLDVEDPAKAPYIGDTDFERQRSAGARRSRRLRATPTRPSSRTTTPISSRRTRTSPVSTGQVLHRGPGANAGGRGPVGGVAGVAAGPDAERQGRLRRLRLPADPTVCRCGGLRRPPSSACSRATRRSSCCSVVRPAIRRRLQRQRRPDRRRVLPGREGRPGLRRAAGTRSCSSTVTSAPTTRPACRTAARAVTTR